MRIEPERVAYDGPSTRHGKVEEHHDNRKNRVPQGSERRRLLLAGAYGPASAQVLLDISLLKCVDYM
jgi:hypothetical protein